MSEYSLSVLYSGSKGNSTLIRKGSINILIDAGKSARALCNALKSADCCIDEIDAIFITHEHTDHVSALNVLTKKHKIPVHIVKSSAAGLLARAYPSLEANLCIHPPLYELTITKGNDEITVSSFTTPHDSSASVGYRVRFECCDGTYKSIGYVTDLGHISEEIRSELQSCETVVIESNHDEDMLRFGTYPYQLKQRILSQNGHLSNTDCANFALELTNYGTKNIVLAHLSEENNTPALAYKETHNKIKELSDVALFVASPSKIITV